MSSVHDRQSIPSPKHLPGNTVRAIRKIELLRPGEAKWATSNNIEFEDKVTDLRVI